MFNIRPFEATDADYEAFAVLESAIWPEFPDTVEEWKHRDTTRDSQYLFRRFLVEKEGEVVADGVYLEPWWSMKPGKYFINVGVHPDHRREGIGTALYDFLMAQVNERDPALITANTREDQTDALRFLEKRGFVRVMRYPVSHLDVPSFDPAPFASTLDRVKGLGIEIRPLVDIMHLDEDWQRKLYDLTWEILQDVPSPDPLTQQSFENFQERTLGDPGFRPDGQFIALDAGQWVGMSALWTAQGDPGKLYTGLTGVVRSHRRKGIATALKVRSFDFAKEYGAKIIETDNEENNPMYLLNMKLGFEPQPAWIDFEKRIKEAE